MKQLIILSVFTIAIITTAFSPTQILNTSLTVTVRDELGNAVEGAEIMLFETEEDYTKEKNVAFKGVSDNKGLVKLKKLKAISYFIIARKGDKDNSGGGERIGALEDGKFNKATVIIQ